MRRLIAATAAGSLAVAADTVRRAAGIGRGHRHESTWSTAFPDSPSTFTSTAH